jgi:hypothetical protein
VFQVAVSVLYLCAEGVSRICLRSGHLLCSCCLSAVSPYLLITGLHFGVFALHSLFLYSDMPPPRPPSYRMAQAIFEPNLSSRINNPQISSRLFFLLTPLMNMEQSVPKRRHKKFRRRGIIQQKEYDIFTIPVSTSAWRRTADFNNYFFLFKRDRNLLCLT